MKRLHCRPLQSTCSVENLVLPKASRNDSILLESTQCNAGQQHLRGEVANRIQ